MNIVITGASSGIGFETALLLSNDPENTVIVISRNKEKLDLLVNQSKAQQPKATIISIPFDLEKDTYTEELLPEITKYCPTIDVLINNAGALVSKPFETLSNEDWTKMFEVNVLAPVKLIRLLLPYMGKQQRSHIVNIGSMGGFQGSAKFAGLSAYSSSKAMLAGLSECLAEEFKDKNVFVNCLALGSAQTEMLNQAFPGYLAPLTASKMAEFIADFALKSHQYINGKVIPVSLSTP